MICPKCGYSGKFTKDGFAGQPKRQRYKCHKCEYLFVKETPKNKWPDCRSRVVELLKRGCSYAQIARDVGVNRSTVTTWIKTKGIEDEEIKRFIVITLQLYIEKVETNNIAAILGINQCVVANWVFSNAHKKTEDLPRLERRSISYESKPKFPRYNGRKWYSIVFHINGSIISIKSRPKDFMCYTRTYQIGLNKYLSGFAMTRLIQLFLGGMDLEPLFEIMKLRSYDGIIQNRTLDEHRGDYRSKPEVKSELLDISTSTELALSMVGGDITVFKEIET